MPDEMLELNKLMHLEFSKWAGSINDLSNMSLRGDIISVTDYILLSTPSVL